MSRLFAVTILDSPGEPDQRLEAAHRLGEPSNLIFGNFWDFVPTEGGGSANPKFLSNFSRTNFTMVNGQKCDETHST